MYVHSAVHVVKLKHIAILHFECFSILQIQFTNADGIYVIYFAQTYTKVCGEDLRAQQTIYVVLSFAVYKNF